METIKIKDNVEYITLGQLLKIEGIISTGGEAKDYLAENPVKVDGELENRRGRKLYRGMSVELNNEIINLE
ncbi:MAG: S4 domain-containing protein YaaA [Acholeplasmatales bacterium]|nr:S4 domain-containing protein YaaA [Acholeplasmatales bacterium]